MNEVFNEISTSDKTAVTQTRAKATVHQILMMGIARILGGFYTTWTNGVTIGLPKFLLTSCIFIIGYACIVFCLAEMCTALPFTGGLYGIVRGIVSPGLGFICGICEIIFNAGILASYYLVLGNIIASTFSTSPNTTSIVTIIMICLTSIIPIAGGNYLWRIIMLTTYISIILLLVYILGGLSVSNYSNNNPNFQWGHLTFATLNDNYFFGGFFFIGFESLPILAYDCVNVKKAVKVTLLYTFAFAAVLCIPVIFVNLSSGFHLSYSNLGPDLISLSYGYAKLFHASSASAVNLLSLPALLAATISILFITGRVMKNMTESLLLPAFISNCTYGPYQSPYAAYLIIISITIFWAIVTVIRDDMHRAVEIPLLIQNFLVSIAYIQFKLKYTTLKGDFQSPFGIYGAIFILFALLGLFASCIMSIEWFETLGFVIFFVIVCAIYYFRIKPYQGFNEDEIAAMFPAYLINANRRTRQKLRKRKSIRSFLNVTNDLSYNRFSISTAVSNLNIENSKSLEEESIDSRNKKPSFIRINFSARFHNNNSNKVIPASNIQETSVSTTTDMLVVSTTAGNIDEKTNNNKDDPFVIAELVVNSMVSSGSSNQLPGLSSSHKEIVHLQQEEQDNEDSEIKLFSFRHDEVDSTENEWK